MVLSWATGFLMNIPPIWITSDVSNGNCIPYANYPSKAYGLLIGVYSILLAYIIPITTFLLCYGHIIVTIRRSGKLLSSHDNGINAVQSKNDEKSIIKIMIVISGSFAICWTPYKVFVMMATSGCCHQSLTQVAWNVSMFLGHMTICVQPFVYVYGLNSGRIKKHLLKIFQQKASTASTDNLVMSHVTSHDHI